MLSDNNNNNNNNNNNDCVVPENIQVPTTEQNSRGWGSEAQEIPEGRGLDNEVTFQRVNINSFLT